MNVRELCQVVGAALHVPDVERYAARLVRRGLLPRAGCEVGAPDAALLLAAVAAAPRPADAPRAVATLADLPLAFVERKPGSARFSTWMRGTDDDIAAMFSNPLDALAAAIEEALDPEGQFVFGSMQIAEGGVYAGLHGCLGADCLEYRAGYILRGMDSPSGLIRFGELHREVIEALAGALWPPAAHVISHHKLALPVH